MRTRGSARMLTLYAKLSWYDIDREHGENFLLNGMSLPLVHSTSPQVLHAVDTPSPSKCSSPGSDPDPGQ